MVELQKLKCERCGHTWVRRDLENVSKVCPKCKSPYWMKPPKQGSKSYVSSYLCPDCGDVVVITSHIPNPLFRDHTCNVCGGVLWKIGDSWSKNWGKTGRCKGCGQIIFPGDLIGNTVNDCGCLVMYHARCIPKSKVE